MEQGLGVRARGLVLELELGARQGLAVGARIRARARY